MLGGSAGTGGKAGQGGAAGSGAEGGTSGSDGDGGAADGCTPEMAPYAVVDPDAQELDDIPSIGSLGVTARADPVVVEVDIDGYRVFALNVRNEVVYADIPYLPPSNFAADWIRIGSGNDYFFSPPAIASVDGRMYVFGVAADRSLYYSLQEQPPGPWTEPRGNDSGILSPGIWSATGMKLRDDALSASATAFGNVIIAARCENDNACVAVQPVQLMNDLTFENFLHFGVASDFKPAVIEAAIDLESGPKVHIAITDKDGTMHYGVGAAEADSNLREEDFAWTELSGMCFASAPTLVANMFGVDLFARGTDGAIYRRPLQGTEGFTRISPPVDTHPLVISEGNGGVVVFAMPDGGSQATLRRFINGGWTSWWKFTDDSSSLLSSFDRPFPGAALKGRFGVKLVARNWNSELWEYAFVGVN